MVHVGEVVLDGLTRANANRLLRAADEVGLPRSVVRTTSTGFVVPKQVADVLGPAEGEKAEPEGKAEKKPPRKRRTRKKNTDQ